MILLALCLLAQSQADQELQKQLEKAIQADQQQTQQGQPANPPAPPAAVTGSTGTVPQTLMRGAQSLNPDISAILDATMGWQRRAPQFLNGDDPNLHGDTAHALGFTAQEVEVAASAVVDPYFKGEVYLTIANLSGLEVEEAFATSTSLPWNLQVKAGSFRSAFGRQNGQHLHVQDFTRRPLINAAFLGDDGLRGPGAQVSWLAPLPFFLTFYAEALSVSNAPASIDGPLPEPVKSFGANVAQRPTLTAEAKFFLPFGEEWSLYGGLNFASGESPGLSVASGGTMGAGRQTQLFGADVYVKWKPANVAQTYGSVAFQAEVVVRHLAAGDGLADDWDGGAYGQAVVQFARRWFVGARGDLIGLPASSVTARTARGAVDLTFQGSEFMRIRAYAELEKGNISFADQSVGMLLPAVQPSWAPALFFQLEISIGAHGAHPF
ncbi:MAG: hypothetical protein E6J78_10355 [Deltaproteobacteria bacterium]|nr:MAG: hypothetical protein E6J78_10355 [Deltaproteobacteria bacterium]